MDLKTKIKKGNNKQDKNKAGAEEASRLLLARSMYETNTKFIMLESRWHSISATLKCDQKVSPHAQTRIQDNDVAKDCVKGGTSCLKCQDDMTKSCGRGSTTCLKCLDGMAKSCIKRYVDNIEYKS